MAQPARAISAGEAPLAKAAAAMELGADSGDAESGNTAAIEDVQAARVGDAAGEPAAECQADPRPRGEMRVFGSDLRAREAAE
jgi:hypothetical protein